jgi:Pectate lyase superfamily protein/Bacterial Ig domain
VNFQRKRMSYRLLIVAIAIGIFQVVSFAQPASVSITVPITSPTPAPTGAFTVTAAATASGGTSITKVVFYRNDVPYFTDTSYPYQMPQNLGQDTYTFRARAYDSAGKWKDSSEEIREVRTPRVVRMGDTIGGTPTEGPNRYADHTDDVKAAIAYLSSFTDGGTLVFPCKFPEGDLAIYNISDTIVVPDNVTLQGESSEVWGGCRIYWYDVSYDYDPPGEPSPSPTPTPTPTPACIDGPEKLRKPMFKILGNTSRVRFRDMSIYSRTSSQNCYRRDDHLRIENENTVGIELTTDDKEQAGDIKDVIFENISISNFTYGIKAVSDPETDFEISNVKIRGYRPEGNHRQILIDARYAYNWDVQNLDPDLVLETQGIVEILNAGAPAEPDSDDQGIKFLQLNCNGSRAYPVAFCVSVEKHGGLYFRQSHHEGIARFINVRDVDGANEKPIVFEASAVSGQFEDAGMKLFLIGNALTAAPEQSPPTLDDGHLRFLGDGVDSEVYDCGDVHYDGTNVTDDDPVLWSSFRMSYTHSERNRGSFFADDGAGTKYVKSHRICPYGVDGVPNIDTIGGMFFDNGVMPTEAVTYNSRQFSNTLDSSSCPSGDYATCLENLMDYNDSTPDNGGSVYIPAGSYPVDRTVNVPSGHQIIGAPGAELVLGVSASQPTTIPALLHINVPVLDTTGEMRASSIVIRNLGLSNAQTTGTGLEIVNEDDSNVGVSSDIHLSGLTFEGFDNGFYAGRTALGVADPMIDGISLKHLTFADNTTSAKLFSHNSSNWNVMNLQMETGAAGWDQHAGGGQGFQNVRCEGLADCFKVQLVTNMFLNGMRKTQDVDNALTVLEGASPFNSFPYVADQYTSMVLRNNDFTSSVEDSGRVRLFGKSFITSMNNKYQYFTVDDDEEHEPNKSRLTYCGDSYPGTPYSDDLDELYYDHWIGTDVPTRITCDTRPVPWDDAVRWTFDPDDDYVGVPMAGNFFDNSIEDLVVYREASGNSRWLIQQQKGPGRSNIQWGTTSDIPMIAHFFPGSRAQILIWRPSSGQWWVKDPNNGSNNFVYTFGTAGDIPFVGNFYNESGSVSGNMDEVGIYRPSNGEIWIVNPRSGTGPTVYTTSSGYSGKIHAGDFLGLGYDQLAFYSSGSWTVVNPNAGTTTSAVTHGTSGDIPVPGKYLSGSCTQLGVWTPSTQLFKVKNHPSCASGSTLTMQWGSDDDFGSQTPVPDIPLTVNDPDTPTLRRPTVYRPTKGAFDHSLADGLWWIHDLF